MFNRLSVFVLAAAGALSTSFAWGGYIMPGAIGNNGSNGFNGAITAYSSSDVDTDRAAVYAVNGGGMQAGGADYSAYGYGETWLAGGAAGQWFKADLGATYLMDHFLLWNANIGSQGRGAASANVYVSTVASPGAIGGSDWTQMGTGPYPFSMAPSASGYNTPDNVALGGASARWVALDISGPIAAGQPFVGFSEIQFWGTQVPEPSAMTLLGSAVAGLLAYAWRKRR